MREGRPPSHWLKNILYAISNIFHPVWRGDIHVMYARSNIYGDLIYQMLGIVERNVGNVRIVKYSSHAVGLQATGSAAAYVWMLSRWWRSPQ